MKKISLVGVALAVSMYTGCSKPIPSPYIEKNKTIPKLNILTTKEIGEDIYIKQGNISYYAKLESTPEELKSSEYNPWWLLAGGVGLGIMLLTPDSIKVMTIRNWGTEPWIMICNKDNNCLVDKNKDNIFTHFGSYPDGELEKIKEGTPYSKISIESPKAFRYSALYQGRIEKKIKISYREFTKDMARPSFTQDIEYELKENGATTIGFRGLRIDVIEATNMDITYKVTKDYN